MPLEGASRRNSRDWRLRVTDMLEAITKIERYTAGISFEDFRDNDLVVDAVALNRAIIGEAARSMPVAITQYHVGVPWRVMQDMRNILIHRYFGIDRNILWSTIRDDLPSLRPLLQAILDEQDEQT